MTAVGCDRSRAPSYGSSDALAPDSPPRWRRCGPSPPGRKAGLKVFRRLVFQPFDRTQAATTPRVVVVDRFRSILPIVSGISLVESRCDELDADVKVHQLMEEHLCVSFESELAGVIESVERRGDQSVDRS